MKARVLALLLMVAGVTLGQISVGIRIGAPPPVRVVRVQPRSPGQGYLWVGGYWYPVSGHYKWHDGYWSRPAYTGAHWVEPHHDGERYFAGYWDGEHGQVAHDHASDHDRIHRDYKPDHDHQ